MTPEELKEREKYYYQKYKAKTTEKNWERQIRANGWTPAEYATAFLRQGGLCYICREPSHKKRLATDHCHRTGNRRHLLCTRCNTVLGLIKEDASLLQKMGEYCAQ